MNCWLPLMLRLRIKRSLWSTSANNRFAPVCMLRCHFRKMFLKACVQSLHMAYKTVSTCTNLTRGTQGFVDMETVLVWFQWDNYLQVSDDCLHLFTDASGLGYGAVFGAYWFFGEWPLTWKTQPISFLEQTWWLLSGNWSSRVCNLMCRYMLNIYWESRIC